MYYENIMIVQQKIFYILNNTCFQIVQYVVGCNIYNITRALVWVIDGINGIIALK